MLLLTIVLIVALIIILICIGILIYLSAKDDQQKQLGFVGKIVVNCRDFKEFKFLDLEHALRWFNYQVGCQRPKDGPEIIIQLYADRVLIKEKKL